MTSIEWLIEEIEPYATSKFRDTFKQIIHLAKEMHKQEIIDAVDSNFTYSNNEYPTLGEQYYQEKFKTKKQLK